MHRKRNLDRIRIASPCPASWADMVGDDRKRFCNSCSMNVYNLSAMSREEAQAVLDAAPGRLCVRFYRREDGKVLTRDCPIGRKDLHQKRAVNLATTAAVAFALSAATEMAAESVGEVSTGTLAATPGAAPVPVMGEMAVPVQGNIVNRPRLGRVVRPGPFLGLEG